MDETGERRTTDSDAGGESTDDRMARKRRGSSHEELREADDASYTGRPSGDHPEEGGATRDHDDEAVERSGSEG